MRKVKTTLLWIGGFLIALFLLLLLIGGSYGFYAVNYYRSLSIEDTLSNQKILSDFGCSNKTTPAQYGFSQYQEINYPSLDKKIKLTGWYIDTGSSADKVIFITEGRWVNRLKAIKYLEVIKNAGLDLDYHVIIADMRNSGNSTFGNSGIGYYIADDMAATMLYVNEAFHKNQFVVWGFSQSAMAAAILLNKKCLQKKLEEKNITIEKVILDSPLSNVSTMIYDMAANYEVPSIFANVTLFFLFLDTDFYLPNMRLGKLLNQVSCPVLILQSEKDQLTKYEVFQKERVDFDPCVKVKIFLEGKHVSSYLVKENKLDYTETVKEFLD